VPGTRFTPFSVDNDIAVCKRSDIADFARRRREYSLQAETAQQRDRFSYALSIHLGKSFIQNNQPQSVVFSPAPYAADL
jgi:hypothetical protein